jgi:hypothetical protein
MFFSTNFQGNIHETTHALSQAHMKGKLHPKFVFAIHPAGGSTIVIFRCEVWDDRVHCRRELGLNPEPIPIARVRESSDV